MSSAFGKARIKLVSKPCLTRIGLIPMTFGIVLSWAFIGIWSFVAVLVLPQNIYWSVLLLIALLAFVCVLGCLTYAVIQDTFCQYVFEISDHDVVLLTVDRLRRRSFTQMILLEDIQYAEYYPYRDSASIVFYAPYMQLEVPLWPMGIDGQDIVDFVTGRGIRVVNVQSDDKIPD